MRLYLVQTGEAATQETTDFDRPLTSAGRLNVEKLASLLSTVNLDARRVIHSGALRAEQTLEMLRWAATPDRGRVEKRPGLGPQDPVEPWVGEINGWTEDAVIVGHQPFLGRLAAQLLAGRGGPPVVTFVPGTAVCLERGAEGWSVIWMIPPWLVTAVARY